MYSVAVMPALLASGWLQSQVDPRWGQLGLFLLVGAAAGLGNLSNDVFDDDTGVDTVGKPYLWCPDRPPRSSLGLPMACCWRAVADGSGGPTHNR